MSARTKLYRLHDRFGKHRAVDIATVFNGDRRYCVVLSLCSCGALFHQEVSHFVGDHRRSTSVMLRRRGIWNDQWRGNMLQAISGNKGLLKAYKMLNKTKDIATIADEEKYKII